jgi:hypothetical protein
MYFRKEDIMYEFYKIKSPYDKQYSSGMKNGYIHKSKKGKTWNTLGALKSHLTTTKRWDEKAFELFYNNWLIIKITENGVETLGKVKDFRKDE